MLQRYLGNKTVLIEPILSLVEEFAEPGEWICDAFSGSLAVSYALKRAGYKVASNDINLFSHVYATAFLSLSKFPKVELSKLITGHKRAISNDYDRWKELIELLIKESMCDIPKKARRTDIYDHYCESGNKSAFRSARGTEGRRRFFQPENARSIDRALSRIRWWWRNQLIDYPTRCLLISILLDAIEKISNTQGTYHDFPRDFTDPRAHQRLSLTLPSKEMFKGQAQHFIGRAEDSLEFIVKAPEHKVLYLDPPYNFRQYTSYYFFPNFVCKYPDIDDLDKYLSEIQFVRGQNMSDDFSSTFCKPSRFLEGLEHLVRRAKCKYIVLSYFDGKNHWSDFKSEPDMEGRVAIENFLRSSLFKKNSVKCYPVERLNYQSYGGYKASTVSEFLFVAEKNLSLDKCSRKLSRRLEDVLV